MEEQAIIGTIAIKEAGDFIIATVIDDKGERVDGMGWFFEKVGKEPFTFCSEVDSLNDDRSRLDDGWLCINAVRAYCQHEVEEYNQYVKERNK